MRIAIGAFSHEANTFCSSLTGWDAFGSRRLVRGEAMLQGLAGTNTEEAGALTALSERSDCQVIPTLAARALSGGPVLADVFHAVLDELLQRLRAALPLDGVLLVLHGAMMSTDDPDATGAILQAVRDLVGAEVPVVGTLDLHANVTARMVECADALIGYHTAPHVDMYEAGETAARVLLATVDGRARPRMALARLPMIVPSENARHTDGPLSEVIAMARELEATGAILHGGVYPVQPWLDISDVGCSVVVVTDGDADAARRHADHLARAFWERRAAFEPDLVPPDEALRRALARPSGTTVLCDSADSPTSGSTGDSTVILRAALDAEPLSGRVLLNVVDAPAVSRAMAAGVGATVTVRVGGRRAPAFFEPVEFTGHVKTISDGVFRFKGPGMRGTVQTMGRAVVLTRGEIHLVVMERAVSQWDPELYRSLGEEPADARAVQVKSPAAFRAAYGEIMDEAIIVASPGPSTPYLTSLPWRHIRRPLYPFDPDVAF